MSIQSLTHHSDTTSHKLCTHHKSESVFLSVCGSKQMTIGFHSLILGWKETDLGDLFLIVRLTKLSEWWVDDCNLAGAIPLQ